MSADIVARAMAAAQGRSANTQTLIKALRSQAMFPQPSWRCPANDVATITAGTAYANSALTGAAYFNANVPVTNTGKITWLCGAADKDANSAYFARGAWYAGGRDRQYAAYEFTHTGTQFEIQMVCNFLAVQTPNFRVLVNDRIAGTAALPTDGQDRYILIQFPTSATRRIRLEFAGGRHRGINVASTGEVSGTGRSYPLIVNIGDSFAEGTGTNFIDGEAIALIRALGGNPANAAVAGTGLLNPGTGGRVAWTDSNRLADLALNGFTDQITLATPNVAMMVIMMSVNDFGQASTTWNGAPTYQAAIAKALYTLIDHAQTQRPGKPIVVFGPTAPIDPPSHLDAYRMRDAGQEVCASVSNVWFIDRLSPGPVLRKGTISSTATTGTLTNTSKTITALGSTSGVSAGSMVVGNGIPTGARVQTVDSATQVTLDVAATAGGAGTALTFRNDQASLYTITTDTTHPNQFGHNLDALWMARQVRELILSQFA